MLSIKIYLGLIILLNIFIVLFYDFYSKYFKIIDYPDQARKFHKSNNIKVFGGSIILCNILLYGIFFLIFKNNIIDDVFFSHQKFILFIITCILIYLVGLFDDIYDIPAINKSVLLTIIIVINLFLTNNYIHEIRFSFNEIIYLNHFSLFFTLICYLIFINAFNMLDGVNLQIGKYSFFLVFFLLLNSLNWVIGLTLIFSLLSFSKLNYENKIFLGDNGSYLLAYIFSYLFINYYNMSLIKFADSILLVMLLPGLEIFRLTIQRALSNKNILKGDRSHIHHLIYSKTKNIYAFLIIFAMMASPFLFSKLINNNSIALITCSILYFITINYFIKKK